MGQQRTFAELAWTAKKKVTRRERFLAEMNEVIPWAAFVAPVEPHYPKAGQRGRPPLGIEKIREAAVGVSEGAVSRPAQEHGTRVHCLRPRESVFDASSIAVRSGDVSLKTPGRAPNSAPRGAEAPRQREKPPSRRFLGVRDRRGPQRVNYSDLP